MQARKKDLGYLPCLVCGVDSGPTLQFFIWLIGGMLLSSFLFLLWAFSKGKFQKKNLESQTIDIERDTL